MRTWGGDTYWTAHLIPAASQRALDRPMAGNLKALLRVS